MRATQLYGATLLGGAVVATLMLEDRPVASRPPEAKWWPQRVIGFSIDLGAALLTAGCAADLLRLAVSLPGQTWAAVPMLVRHTLYGKMTVAKLVAAVALRWLAPVGFERRHVTAIMLPGGALALLAMTFAATGHAVVGPSAFVSVPIQSLHILAAIIWSGALLQLALFGLTLWSPGSISWFRDLVGNFTQLGLISMIVLFGSGFMITQSRLVVPGELVTTTYGGALTAKLIWVLTVLLLAGLHRYLLLPGWDQRRRLVDRVIRWSLLMEAAAGLIIVWLAAVLATTPPPR